MFHITRKIFRPSILVVIILSCCSWSSAADNKIDHAKVDIACFARIVTSDPNRTEGTAATRTEEFPAEDVFLETDLKPAVDGQYIVPTTNDGLGCIGTRWHEMRFLRRLELHWADTTALPPSDAVELQYWIGHSYATTKSPGSSPWQGEWKPLPAKLEKASDTWSWLIGDKDQPLGTYRVRWVFPATDKPIAVKKISAYGRAENLTAKLRVELREPEAGKHAQVVVYNGSLLGTANHATEEACNWDLSRPLELKVRYSKTESYKADRTVLRFKLPEKMISVAVEDIVANGCVYVPSVGLFVTGNPPRATLPQFLRQVAEKRTVLQQIRERPDQTFAQAMAITHNPTQKLGSMVVGLACDNRKFVVEREGTIRFHFYDTPDATYPMLVSPKESWWMFYKDEKPYFQLTPSFGNGKGTIERQLDGGWLPKPVTTVLENGVKYQQSTYVAPIDEQSPYDCPGWYRPKAVCVAEYLIQNTLPTDTEVALTLKLSTIDNKTAISDRFQEVKNGLLAVVGDRVMAYFDAGQSSPLSLTKQKDGIQLTGKLTAGGRARLAVCLPAWPVTPAEYAALGSEPLWAAQFEQYWKDAFAKVMTVDVPDRMLANVIRASQVHCLLAARNEDRGKYVAPWIAAMCYGPFESEAQAVIRGMDMCGHSDFARRGLEFFINRYNNQGYLTSGYTLVGTGENLWNIAEHYHRTGDREWLENVSPVVTRACQWIVRQRSKTRGQDSAGEKVLEHGLMPPGVTADWPRYAYRFYNDSQYCHGLESAAHALSSIGHPDAPMLMADAKAYREDLIRAYRWTQTRCPVVPLSNDTWVQNHPTMLGLFGDNEEMIPAAEAKRWDAFLYSVEIGSHHLAANRILDPNSVEVAATMDYLEDQQFLREGLHDYPEDKNRKDVFNLGGFAKAQPYYARNAEVYALRDDVKPFVRSYFNTLSAMLSEETLSLWESFANHGVWNKTHETGWFLCQTAIMFTMDRGDDLWLAPFATNNWLKNGMTVAVRNAPTRFGKVAFRITSHVEQGRIEAIICQSWHNAPKEIVLRLRHPEGKPMIAVEVDGKPYSDFDAQREIVRLKPSAGEIRVVAKY